MMKLVARDKHPRVKPITEKTAIKSPTRADLMAGEKNLFYQPSLSRAALSAALTCITGLGSLAISSPAFAVAPTVGLNTPTNNARYTSPAAITLTAVAASSGDTISKVEFYQGSTLLGAVTTPPTSTTGPTSPPAATASPPKRQIATMKARPPQQ
ncbi:hypothetical protein UNDKW_4452 [Undibacterium sp. KW1]|uniref:Ig-like domain-containing protein n=1 Tax=Undibacterium sp. KW1 TaxID=2058624 RepID=UPI001331D172|nr:Ig-like domain-containing protein [Undibacterium sp. KW1]BBB62725.1 hypothetical protein UNDKW_4452 [Undibacterium sp. KW1]